MPAVGNGQPEARPRWPPAATTLPNDPPEMRAADGVGRRNQWAVVVWAPLPAVPWGHVGPAPVPVGAGPLPIRGPPGFLVEGVRDLLGQMFPAPRL